MKNLTSSVLVAGLALLCSVSLPAQSDSGKGGPAMKQKMGPRARLSPHETISAYCGGDRRTGSLVTITYGRPYSAKGGKGEVRKIWGGLVPWDKADRLGADEATTILLHDPIEVNGTTIPAGAYTLYIVASESGTSKLAFSSNVGKWGIPVDEKHDVARVDLKKDELPEQVDQLTLALDGNASGGTLRIMWEKTQFSLPFAVKKS